MSILPTDVGGLTIWLKADAITGLVDGNALSELNPWPDSSAGGTFDFTTTSGGYPTYKTASGPNSKPYVLFDGSNDDIKSGVVAGTGWIGTNALTWIFVLKQDGSQANNGLFNWSAPDAGNQAAAFVTHSNTIYFDVGDENSGGRMSVAQPSGWDDNWHVLTFRRNGAAGIIRVDGTQILSSTFSDNLDNTQSSEIILGTRGSDFFKGSIAEWAAYNVSASDADVLELEWYAAEKYAIAGPTDPTPDVVVTAKRLLLLGKR